MLTSHVKPLLLVLAIAAGFAINVTGPSPTVRAQGATPPFNPGDRREAVRAYYDIYLPALAVANDWNGSVPSCTAGTTGEAYTAATLQMVQYFRTMAGLSEVAVSAEQSAAAQEAALMISANGAVSNNPPDSWQCYTAAGAAAAAESSMAFGAAGPQAVVQYMTGAADQTLADRRRLLYPPLTTIGLGSTANANVVWAPNEGGTRPPTPQLAAWPAANAYTPYQLAFPRWSVALNTDESPMLFEVVMDRIVGASRIRVPVTLAPWTPGQGDDTVVFEPQGLTFGPGMGDQTFRIEVWGSGWPGGGPWSYLVTIIDPARRVSDGTFWVGLTGQAGAGYLEKIGGDVVTSYHPNQWWSRVSWPAYNDAVGTARPAVCDLFGDHDPELVIGLAAYPEMGGFLEVKSDSASWHQHLGWLRIPWAAYNDRNGETFPACGDVDGDGRDEIIVGLGTGGDGWVALFDDGAAGFAPLGSGWLQVGWPDYNAADGAVHPAVGNYKNDDRAEELAFGFGAAGNAMVRMYDDALTGFAPLWEGGWLDMHWHGGHGFSPPYGNGETWPAFGDVLAGDGGYEELIVGLGPGSGGWFRLLRWHATFGWVVATPMGRYDGWVQVPWPSYASAAGATYPAAADLDGDFQTEIIIGLGDRDGFGYLSTWGRHPGPDWPFVHRSWPRVHWPLYVETGGGTTPGGR